MIITRLVVFDRSDLPENLRNNPLSSVTLSDFTKEDNFDSTQIKNAKMVVFEDKGECKVLKNLFVKSLDWRSPQISSIKTSYLKPNTSKNQRKT